MPPPPMQHQADQPGVPPAGNYASVIPPSGQYADMWNPPPPSGGYPAPRMAGKRKQAPIALIVIIAIGIALVGGGAIAYFTVLRPGETANVAQKTIDEYFNALGSGDTKTIKSLHTSAMQPSSEALSTLAYMEDMMTYSDFKLKTIDESAGEMSVEIVDFVATVSFMGQSESMRMSELQSEMGMSGNTVVKLKEEGGKWLINEPDILSPFNWMMPDIPDLPGTVVPLDGC